MLLEDLFSIPDVIARYQQVSCNVPEGQQLHHDDRAGGRDAVPGAAAAKLDRARRCQPPRLHPGGSRGRADKFGSRCSGNCIAATGPIVVMKLLPVRHFTTHLLIARDHVLDREQILKQHVVPWPVANKNDVRM